MSEIISSSGTCENKRMLDFYFRSKNFEHGGKIYEKLGIKQAQAIVMGTVGKYYRRLGFDETRRTYFIGKKMNEESLREYESGTRLNEAIHAPHIPLDASMLLYYLSSDNYEAATGWGLLLIINTYCLMIQRYTRARVTNVLKNRYK